MRNRISHSIACTGVGVALLAGLILSAVQIFLDYQDQQEQNDALVENALFIASAGATQAAYELSSGEASAALQSLMVHEYFTLAEIINENGESLSELSRDPQPHMAEPLFAALSSQYKTYELSLYHDRGDLEVGKLRVSVHSATIMQDFFSRSVRQLIAGILRSLILAGILLTVFNLMLTRPLSEYVESLKKIDPRAPRSVSIPARIANANDELTELAVSTNAIMQANQEYLDELEKKRQEANEFAEKLRHSERLSIVGKLTGGVAHDFNNILAIILGNFELLQTDSKLDSDSKLLVDSGIKATKHGAKLTSQLLAYSRRQPLDPKPIGIKDFFINLENLLLRALGKQYNVEFDLKDDLWQSRADVRQLETVILNLAINARDAMPNGGTLTIEAFNLHIDRLSQLVQDNDLKTGDYVCICVMDSGTGMSSDVMKNAFEPYFTTKEVGKGSGLGLSMAYGFIKQSGGHIQIRSDKAAGTCIKIYMPRFAKPAPMIQVEKLPASTVNYVPENKTILVVEDNEQLSELLVIYLTQLNITTVTADDAQTALKKAGQKRHFDGALIDVVLPGTMNGPGLADQLLSLRPDLPVAFMSGYTADTALRDQRFDEGAVLLQKPFAFDDLKEVVHALFHAEQVS